MSFKPKTDPFGLSTAANSPLEILSTTDNLSAQVVEAQGQTGEVVAHEVFGESLAPSAEYKVKSAGNFAIVLGDVSTYLTKKIMLGNVSINTSAGGEPTVSASGEQVEDTAVKSHYFDAGSAGLSTVHHAQILFGAFQLSGDGNHLAAANYTASCEIGKSTVAGRCIASDVVKGQIEAQITVTQVGSDSPTLTPGEGWAVVSPLTCTNPDADYPSWTATLKKYLTHAEASA